MKKLIYLLGLVPIMGQAQTDYSWQQRVHYHMQINFDDLQDQFDGKQQLTYWNNSDDTLNTLYYHLYYNAFQPGSMMDERSRDILDPDRRVTDRISQLKENEIGYQNIHWLTVNGDTAQFTIQGTVMKVTLTEPILPHSENQLNMEFDAQVPLQIRRTGRDNKEGIDYTMTQWYPKLAEYDTEGWHNMPYVGREFFGVWGDFDVEITMDQKYVVAGTGEIMEKAQAPTPENMVQDGSTKTWMFSAQNVHDFAWAADPDYQHDQIEIPGTTIHFYYQTDTLATQWKEAQPLVAQLFTIMNAEFGQYPYKDFAVIQGGDGGMEYPMCTMILGHGSLKGKVGLIAHEAFHNWYYGILGSNEFLYPWMDEGFTTYAEEVVMDSVFSKSALNPLDGSYKNYYNYNKQKKVPVEPMSTPADFFQTNYSYGVNSYSKGSVFLKQLEYIIGKENLKTTMQVYFEEFKFKHPNPNDFKRIAEKVSGVDLSWYFQHWIYTTNTIDYSIETVEKAKKSTQVVLKKIGNMPMPLDITVTLNSGEVKQYYIPLAMMNGTKPVSSTTETLSVWPWTNPTYSFLIDVKLKDIKSIQIDPSTRMADVNQLNNFYPKAK